jgi:hypothetical protein
MWCRYILDRKGEGNMPRLDQRLQVGQAVRLEERACGYHIAVLAPGELGPTVVEIGSDYILFEDAAVGVRTRLPLHLVDSVAATAEAAQSAA